ncbi:MAG: hypothetical protein ACI8X5_002000 [Planctomycetota bacterium]|jgi:hypothetical protein
MKISNFIVPSLGLGIAVSLLLPTQNIEAWSLIGGSLSQNQRDFRVFNNFSDASDNNNQTPDDQYPGAQGAVMAIWKASVEWGVVPHGDGSGDSTQAAIGSGEANFDPSFQGLATSTGNSNGNTHSQISGSSGGVLAYCETPISDGWRIRYYENINWADGPGTIAGNSYDIQGVACHEYGHALGLGHSAANGATMYPSIGNGIEAQRSISNDDRGGLAAIYGAASASKPVITGVSVGGNQITVTGSGFDNSGNEIWFTQAGTGGTGTPIKATSLNSTGGGTMIVATIPATAGPGDVLVRRNNTSHSGLSNAWPTSLESTGPSCDSPVNYCDPLPNSVGSGATISYSGTTGLVANDLTLTVLGVPAGVPGLFFYASNQTAGFFGEGLLCVQGDLKRLNVQITDSLGFVSKTLDLSSAPFDSGNGQAIAGETKNFQFWYRDTAGGPNGFNTSGALEVTFCE